MATKDPVAITKLNATLRRYRPSRVRVYDANDQSRDVAVPNVRGCWARVEKTIDALPWVRCELLDKTGAHLGYVDNDGAPEDIEELTAPEHGKQLALLRLMLHAQKEALGFQSREHAELLKGCTEMMRVVVEACKQLAGIYQAQVQAVAETAAMARQEPDDLEKALAIIEAIPEVGTKALPFLAGLRGVIKGQLKPAIPGVAAASKPNGAAPSTGTKE